MDHVRAPDKDATLGLDQGYQPLHVRHVAEGAYTCAQSLWRPTPAELTALAAGAFVRLSVLGAGHPPVRLDVEHPTRSPDHVDD